MNEEETNLAIRDKKIVFVQKLKVIIKKVGVFIKKAQIKYNDLMSNEKRAQTITVAAYIACFLLNIFYTPWASNVTDALVSGELTNERFHLFFFDNIFYGVSELIDLLTWSNNIVYVIFAVAVLSLKDICKGFCLDYANGELKEPEKKEKTLGYFQEKMRKAKEESNNKVEQKSDGFKSSIKKKITYKLNDFMVDNILLYLSTLLLYFLSTAGYSALEYMFNNVEGNVFIFVMLGFLLLVLLYAIPNLLKLFMYVAAIAGVSLVVGKADSISIFSDLTVSLISCGLILVINKIISILTDKVSQYLYTKQGLKELKDNFSYFLTNKGIDGSLKVIIIAFSPILLAMAEYFMIQFTVYLLSIA